MAVYLIDYENVGVGGLSGITQLSSGDRVILFYGSNTKTIPFERMVEISRSNARVEFIKTERVAKNYLDFQLTTYLGYLIGQGNSGPYLIISKDTGYDSACDFWRGRNITISRQEALEGTKAETPANGQKTGRKRTAEKPENSANGLGGKAPAARKRSTAKKKTEAPETSGVKAETQEASTGKAETQEASGVKAEKTPEAKEPLEAGKTNRKKSRVPLTESDRRKVREVLKGKNLPAPKYTTVYKIMDASPDKQHFHSNLVKAFGQEQGRDLYVILMKPYEDYQNRLTN